MAQSVRGYPEANGVGKWSYAENVRYLSLF
jgi:hypothetical protein